MLMRKTRPVRQLLYLLVTLVVIAMGTSSARAAAHYPLCTICITGDPEDHTVHKITPDDFVAECKYWFRSFKGPQVYQQIMPQSGVAKALEGSSMTCDAVKAYGAFHSNERDVAVPFGIAYLLAYYFKPKTVFYTGSSCLIFKDVVRLLPLAQPLASFKDVRFEISGNQNYGRIWKSPPFSDWHELQTLSSKAIVTVVDGQSSLGFEPCSSTGAFCRLDTVEPIRKYCSLGKRVEMQTCCPAHLNPFQSKLGRFNGRWSPVGNGCKSL